MNASTRAAARCCAAVVAAALTVPLVGCAGLLTGHAAEIVTQGVLIRQVTVVDTRSGTLAPAQDVVLDAGRIQRISPTRLTAAAGVQVVDGQGRYLVPGYLDMHTHAADTLGASVSDFPVLLAHGVTGLREASGSPPLRAAAQRHNAAVAAGQAAGPRVLMMPGALYAGQGFTPEGARQFVQARMAEGGDYLKIAGGPPAAFLAAIDEARRQGSHAAGHLSPAVRAEVAASVGYRSFEHLGSGLGLGIDCSRDEPGLRAAVLAVPLPPPTQVVNPRVADGMAHATFYRRAIDSHDPERCAALARHFVAQGTWQTVTLIRLRTQAYGEAARHRNEPALRWVDPARRALWQAMGERYEREVSAEARATLQAYYALQKQMVKQMAELGVGVLAGSDLGGGWLVPGVSLHQEFAELAAAGLTPLQVLQATTLNAARFAGREASLGTVEAGKEADLVLLEASPLADVANLGRIGAVVLQGRVFPRTALDALLEDVARSHSARSP